MIYIRKIVGKSMLPNYVEGNIVVFIGLKKIKKGDVILARINGLEQIKRIDKIQNKKIYILGDNLTKSKDSRNYGPINIDMIKAKALFRINTS